MHSDQEGEQQHAGGTCQIRDEQDQPPVEAVRDDPGRNRQHEVGHQARRAHDAEDHWVPGLVVDHDDERHEVQPVTDRGDELAQQQLGQLAVAEELPVGGPDGHAGTPQVRRDGLARRGRSIEGSGGAWLR